MVGSRCKQGERRANNPAKPINHEPAREARTPNIETAPGVLAGTRRPRSAGEVLSCEQADLGGPCIGASGGQRSHKRYKHACLTRSQPLQGQQYYPPAYAGNDLIPTMVKPSGAPFGKLCFVAGAIA